MRITVHALCTSDYHLAQTIGLCNWLCSQNKLPELFVYRNRHLGKYRINPERLELSTLHYRTHFHDYSRTGVLSAVRALASFILRSLFKKTHTTILVSSNGVHVSLLSFIAAAGYEPDTFFSIEDGLGTYGSILHRTKAKLRESDRLLGFPIYFFVETVKQTLQSITTLRSGGIIQIIATRRGWGRRIRLRPYVKNVLTSNIFRCLGSPFPDNTVLFLSQPYVELNLIEKHQYLEVIRALTDYFSQMDKQLLVKAHPSENTSKFGDLLICQFDGPVETLLGLQFDHLFCVVGINSTGLLLASRLFNLRAYRVQHSALTPIDKEISDKGIHRLLQDSTIPLFLN